MAIVAIILTAMQLFPQIYKSVKTKSVRDVSLGLSIVVGLCATSWLIYGIHIKDWPISIANVINLMAALTLLYLKVKR